MQVVVEKKGDLGREMVVTIPAADVEKMLTERLEQVRGNVSLPGFRPGKAPMEVVRKRYAEKVGMEVQRDIIAETMPKAFDKEQVRPAGQPNVNFGTFAEGKDYKYTISFDVMPEVTPKKYEGLKLTRYTSTVDDKLIEKSIAELAKARRVFKKVDGAIKSGFISKINAKGFDKDGQPINGAEVTEFPLEIGSGQFIPGFEDGLVGKKAGDKATLDLTFPKDYHAKELQGLKARFEVEVLEVQEGAAPKMDDAFAQSVGLKDLAELKAKLTERLTADVKAASDQRLKRELFDILDKDNKFPVPASMANAEFETIWRALMEDMHRRGVTFGMMGKSEDEVRAEHRELADRRVRLGLLLAEIGRKHGIEITDAEVTAEVEKIAEAYGPSADKVRQYFKQPQARNEIIGPLYEKKVCDWIVAAATVSEKTISADDLLAEIAG
jgi:trigger factor